MKTLPLIIGDADALIALLNPPDAHHQRAKKILVDLLKQQAQIYYPTSALAEAVTTLQRKLSNPSLAALLVEQCSSGNISLLSVDGEIMALAIKYYNPNGSKQNTFFDAIVAACANKYKATRIFSFDDWYR